MIEVKDYKSMLKYGDIKTICSLTGLTPYLLKTRLAKHEYETVELVKTYFDKKLEILKNSIYEHQES